MGEIKRTRYTMSPAMLPKEILEDEDLKFVGKEGLTILAKRGINTAEDIRHFLYDDILTVTNKYIMSGTAAAVSILKKAIKEKKRIVVYRDYDCDGICAGAIAVSCLRAIKAKAEQYANERQIDGYGLCPAGIDNILVKWPDTHVIMTVDNGISAHEGILYAKKMGLEVIVTDHHEVGETLPEADAVIDPKQKDELYEYPHLCGSGVVFKLMLALFIEMRKNIKPVIDTIDLVAMATVADVVPLIGENHTIVREGIKEIRDGNRLFFQEIIKKLDIKTVKAQGTIAFKIAPIVNAISRMNEDTDRVVEALMSDDESFVARTIEFMIEVNEDRKELTNNQYEILAAEAEKIITDNPNCPCLILRNDNVFEGIVGIIAGKLRQEYVRPVIVFALNNEGVLKGSGRCGEELNIKESLDKISKNLLCAYGGHQKAAGLSIREEDFDQFKAEFTEIAKVAMEGFDFTEKVELDMSIQDSDCTENLCHAMDILEPYGEGFRAPLFGLTATVNSTTFMGQDLKHLKYRTEAGNEIIMWSMGSWHKSREAAGLKPPRKFIGIPGINSFNGKTTVQFIADYAT